MSIPYLPPEIIMNILDYVHLDDLFLNARLVNRMWNVEAMARANDFLTDWPDAVPHLSPVEVECLFPGKRLEKLKFDGKDPQCIFSGQVVRDGIQVKRFWVRPRSEHEPIATGFGKYSIQFPIVKSVTASLKGTGRCFPGISSDSLFSIHLRFKNSSQGEFIRHIPGYGDYGIRRPPDCGAWTYRQEMEFDRAWIVFSVPPRARESLNVWDKGYTRDRPCAPGERNRVLLPAASLKPFVFNLDFEITYYVSLGERDPVIRECRVQDHEGWLKNRR